jgi:hypothetical protein
MSNKEINISAKDINKFNKSLESVLSNMLLYGETDSILLSSNLKVDRTLFVKQFAKLLGIPLFTIDISKITEEFAYTALDNMTTTKINYVNIPYTIEIGEKKINKQFNSLGIKSEDLVSQLKKAKGMKLEGEEYVSQLREDKTLHAAVKEYINLINRIRASSYDSILFLDEFYGTYNTVSEMIAENFFKGKIIDISIPRNTYSIFGANIKNKKIPWHHYFRLVTLDNLN